MIALGVWLRRAGLIGRLGRELDGLLAFDRLAVVRRDVEIRIHTLTTGVVKRAEGDGSADVLGVTKRGEVGVVALDYHRPFERDSPQNGPLRFDGDGGAVAANCGVAPLDIKLEMDVATVGKLVGCCGPSRTDVQLALITHLLRCHTVIPFTVDLPGYSPMEPSHSAAKRGAPRSKPAHMNGRSGTRRSLYQPPHSCAAPDSPTKENRGPITAVCVPLSTSYTMARVSCRVRVWGGVPGAEGL